jgi:hypothetical protein
MAHVESWSAQIVDASIDEQLEARDSQEVGSFVEEVEERVQEKIEQLQAEFGSAADAVAGEAMREAEGYRQTQLRIFDPSFKVMDTEGQGAAAWNDKRAGNLVAVGYSAMERKKDEAYWNRVTTHEETHQLQQAAKYNRSSIDYPGDPEPLDVHSCLVEWHAITNAQQPSSDLTPDYQEHKRRGDALVQFLGTAEPLLTALKSGDMQSLQDLINQKLVLMGQPFSGVVQTEQEYHVAL